MLFLVRNAVFALVVALLLWGLALEYRRK